MESNWLGVTYISSDIPCEIEEMVNQKMEELKEDSIKKFDAFLEKNDLERVMGVIVRKGSINKPGFNGRKEFVKWKRDLK